MGKIMGMFSKATALVLTLELVCGLSVSPNLYAGLCNDAKKQPCPKLINEFEAAKGGKSTLDGAGLPQDAASQSTSHCMQIKSNDEACDATIPFSITYTALAGICALACFGAAADATFGGSALNQTCSWGSMANSLADLGYALNMRRNGTYKDYVRHAEGMIGNDWGLGMTVGGAAANGVLAVINAGLGASGRLVDNAFSSMNSIGKPDVAGGGSAAAKPHGTGGAGGSGAGGGGGGGVGNATPTGLENADDITASADAAPNAQPAGSDQASNASSSPENTFERAASCVSMVTNAALASVKWYDFVALQNGSDKEYKKLQTLIAGSINNTLLGQTTNSGGFGGAAPGSGDGSGGPGVPGGSGLVSATDIAAATKNLTPGAMVNALQSGGTGKIHGHITPEQMKTGVDAFNKKVGPLDKFVADAAANGVGQALGKIADMGSSKNSGAVKGALAKMDGETARVLANRAPAFEGSTGSPGVKSGGGFQFGDLMGKNGAAGPGAGKVEEAKFGGFSNDIWHAGATKSIFEIVSDKTGKLSDRVSK